MHDKEDQKHIEKTPEQKDQIVKEQFWITVAIVGMNTAAAKEFHSICGITNLLKFFPSSISLFAFYLLAQLAADYAGCIPVINTKNEWEKSVADKWDEAKHNIEHAMKYIVKIPAEFSGSLLFISLVLLSTLWMILS